MSQYPFRVGIVHSMAFPEVLDGEGPIVETARVILEDSFFGAIEVSGIKDSNVRRSLASMLSSFDFRVVFCAGGNIIRRGADLNSLEPEVRRQALMFTRGLVDQAKELGAEIFVLCSGPDPGPAVRSRAASALADSMVDLADYAGDDILVSLESFDRDVDKRRLVGPTQEAVELVAEVRKRVGNVGLTIDLSHLPLLKERATTSLAVAKDVLAHSHIGNCMPDADSHPKFGVPGGCNGVPELRDFLSALRSIGYFDRPSPIVSFEVKPAAGERSEAVIAQSKDVLKEAMGGLT